MPETGLELIHLIYLWPCFESYHTWEVEHNFRSYHLETRARRSRLRPDEPRMPFFSTERIVQKIGKSVKHSSRDVKRSNWVSES